MKIKEIPIEYIEVDEKIADIRSSQSEEAIGRYMEKYESGTSKPILLKEIDRKNYILIDGHHRLKAIERLKRRKIEAELIDINDKEMYSKAVECNQEHGVSLTNEEEEKVLINLFEEGKTQEQIAKVFHVGQSAISMRVKRNPMLVKSLSDKINISTINEILSGKTHEEVANILKVIKRSRVTQIWGDFTNEIEGMYNSGTPKEEIIEIQNEKNINLTKEKLDELVEEDYNQLIIGDCLKEIPKLKDGIIDCLIIDPPYGINYQSGYKKEKNDKMKGDTEEAFKLLDKSLEKVKPKLKKNSHIYVFTSWKVFEKVKPIVEKYFEVKNCLIWNKAEWGMGDLTGNYAEKYEMIIFATQGKRKLYSERRPVNVLDYISTYNEEHPTQKPIALLKELITNSTKENELIFDYFAGSGSTLKASKECGRKWLGVEIDEGYLEDED